MANWDERYDSPEYMFGTEPNDCVRELAHLLPPGRVLSLADGEGRNGVFLAQRGYAVTSIDASTVASAKAARLAADRGVAMTTIVANLLEHDIGRGEWQGIVSIFFHLPSAVRREMHARVAEALAPGGVVVLEAYTPKQLEYRTGGPPVADMLMTLAALREDFGGLEILHGEERIREISEGKLHVGTSAVVQFAARKPV